MSNRTVTRSALIFALLNLVGLGYVARRQCRRLDSLNIRVGDLHERLRTHIALCGGYRDHDLIELGTKVAAMQFEQELRDVLGGDQ